MFSYPEAHVHLLCIVFSYCNLQCTCRRRPKKHLVRIGKAKSRKHIPAIRQNVCYARYADRQVAASQIIAQSIIAAKIITSSAITPTLIIMSRPFVSSTKAHPSNKPASLHSIQVSALHLRTTASSIINLFHYEALAADLLPASAGNTCNTCLPRTKFSAKQSSG